METFDLGMVGYYQVKFQEKAKSIFSSLDNNLDPNTVLVRIPENREVSDTTCLEPKDCGYTPDIFSDVSIPAQELSYEKLKLFQEDIQQAVNKNNQRNVFSLCSWPVSVSKYWIIVVLQFNDKVYRSHYSLEKNKYYYSSTYQAQVTSLLDATVNQYFDICNEALRKSDPSGKIIDRDDDEIFRLAGKKLMETVARICKAFEGLYGLYEACNTISSLRYEGAEGIGKMLIARRKHPNIEVILALSNPVKINDYRAVRKLLEMSSNEISLLSDAEDIYGLGKTNTNLYNQSEEDLFSINFTKYYTWELWHANNLMMQVAYRQPELPKKRISKSKFEMDLPRIFPEIKSEEITKLWKLVEEAIKQKHGTMVVVSSEAKEEANRLANQATVIEPVTLTTEIIRVITAIDGAVLIDPSSTCYAIGVILDGRASTKGSSARGARYNSAIRYVETSQNCMAIVVSEDGSIDIVPNLKPQIKRSSILEAIEKLRKLNEENNINKVQNKFVDIMEFLHEQQFYLSPEMCSEINCLKGEIGLRIKFPYYHNFEPEPNQEMNETFFLEESN